MKLRLVNRDALMDTCFRPDKVIEYCESCHHYNMHFACPHHNFSMAAFLRPYPYVLLVSHQPPGKLDEYFYWRDLIDPLLLSYEAELDGLSLVAGSCRNCDTCYDKGASRCTHPKLLRYSFESLGFEVSCILEEYFDEKLLFQPERLHLLYGMLLKDRPDTVSMMNLEGGLRGLSD